MRRARIRAGTAMPRWLYREIHAEHPALHMRRPLALHARVRVSRGFYRGNFGTIVEVLSPGAGGGLKLLAEPNDPLSAELPRTQTVYIEEGVDDHTILTGRGRYGVRFDVDGQVRDYLRYELVELTQRRLRELRGA